MIPPVEKGKAFMSIASSCPIWYMFTEKRHVKMAEEQAGKKEVLSSGVWIFSIALTISSTAALYLNSVWIHVTISYFSFCGIFVCGIHQGEGRIVINSMAIHSKWSTHQHVSHHYDSSSFPNDLCVIWGNCKRSNVCIAKMYYLFCH